MKTNVIIVVNGTLKSEHRRWWCGKKLKFSRPVVCNNLSFLSLKTSTSFNTADRDTASLHNLGSISSLRKEICFYSDNAIIFVLAAFSLPWNHHHPLWRYFSLSLTSAFCLYSLSSFWLLKRPLYFIFSYRTSFTASASRNVSTEFSIPLRWTDTLFFRASWYLWSQPEINARWLRTSNSPCKTSLSTQSAPYQKA